MDIVLCCGDVGSAGHFAPVNRGLSDRGEMTVKRCGYCSVLCCGVGVAGQFAPVNRGLSNRGELTVKRYGYCSVLCCGVGLAGHFAPVNRGLSNRGELTVKRCGYCSVLIYCITSLGDSTHPQHQETTHLPQMNPRTIEKYSSL